MKDIKTIGIYKGEPIRVVIDQDKCSIVSINTMSTKFDVKTSYEDTLVDVKMYIDNWTSQKDAFKEAYKKVFNRESGDF